MNAIASAPNIPGLLEKRRDCDRRRKKLEHERQAFAASRPIKRADMAIIREQLLELAGSWRRVLVDDPAHARPIVLSLLKGRVTYTPLGESKRRETLSC